VYLDFYIFVQKLVMSEKEFCKIYSSFYGEEIDNIKQLVQHCSNAEELKELIEFFITQLNIKYVVK